MSKMLDISFTQNFIDQIKLRSEIQIFYGKLTGEVDTSSTDDLMALHTDRLNEDLFLVELSYESDTLNSSQLINTKMESYSWLVLYFKYVSDGITYTQPGVTIPLKSGGVDQVFDYSRNIFYIDLTDLQPSCNFILNNEYPLYQHYHKLMYSFEHLYSSSLSLFNGDNTVTTKDLLRVLKETTGLSGTRYLENGIINFIGASIDNGNKIICGSDILECISPNGITELKVENINATDRFSKFIDRTAESLKTLGIENSLQEVYSFNMGCWKILLFGFKLKQFITPTMFYSSADKLKLLLKVDTRSNDLLLLNSNDNLLTHSTELLSLNSKSVGA